MLISSLTLLICYDIGSNSSIKKLLVKILLAFIYPSKK